MDTVFRFIAPPGRCGYLPEQTWRLEYEHVSALTPAEYLQRMEQGWRRFGTMMFRPRCPECSACRPLRVVASAFRPDRSQRRNRQANEGIVEVQIDTPSVSRAKLDLFDRFHAFQTENKGWPVHEPKDADEYARSFIDNPFPTEEWCYFIDQRLVGVGYVDALPGALSAIYFFYDPDERGRGLGTWNVLSIIDEARRRGIPHVYLGYYVAGCSSMMYKAKFVPNQVLAPGGDWRDFRGASAQPG
jgi:arginine-tRNA-protein transferase